MTEDEVFEEAIRRAIYIANEALEEAEEHLKESSCDWEYYQGSKSAAWTIVRKLLALIEI